MNLKIPNSELSRKSARFVASLVLLLFPIVALSIGSAFAEDKPELKVEVLPEPFAPNFPVFTVRVRFTNISNNPDTVLRIVRPLPLTFAAQTPQIYKATIRDETGELTRGMPVCGDIFDHPEFPKGTKWPEDFVVPLGWNQSFETHFWAGQKPPRTGPATVSFQYIMPVNPTFTPQPIEIPTPAQGYKFPTNLWHGTATAEEVTIQPAKENK